MRRILLLLLMAALLLSACGVEEAPAQMIQPFTFYYRTADIDFSSENGVIRAEVRDLGNENYTEQDLFSLYFEGPKSDSLLSPFTQDTQLSFARRIGSTLEIRLKRNANSPEEFDHSLTYACLAKTGLALDGISKVRIKVWSNNGTLEDDVTLSESDILLYDSGANPRNTLDVTLYFADETGSFLLTEKQTVPMAGQEELAQQVLKLLLSPPQSGGMQIALPPGTSVLDVSVENRVCSVDFNGDFYDNRPEGEQAEQLALLSVVNTLCELDGIDQVQFYTQGTKLTSYVLLSLSEPWSTDYAPVGPIREELGEFAGTLYLPGWDDNLLHKITVRARARSGATREEAIVLLLFSRAAQNGLAAPFVGSPAPLSVTTTNRVCTVTLAENALPTEISAREMAIRSLTATLTSLPEVNSVVILEGTTPVSAEPLRPEAFWFSIPPEYLS